MHPILAAALPLVFSAGLAQGATDITADSTARAYKSSGAREPCANFDPLRRPHFGDTHVHTAWSFDANSQDTRNTRPLFYSVDLSGENWRAWTCTCPDHQGHGSVCKHILASYYTRRAFELAQERIEPQAAETATAEPCVAEPAEYITHATVFQGEQPIRVEVLAIEGVTAHVRALPVHDHQGMLVAHFPFPSPLGGEVRYSTAEVAKSDLHEVRVFHHQED